MKASFTFNLLVTLMLIGAGCQPSIVSREAPSSTGLETASRQPQIVDNQPLFDKSIREYFSYIDSREYDEAYSMLTPAFQTTHQFDKWSDGYKNTLNHLVKSVSCENESCTVEFIATENTSSNLRKQKYLMQYVLRKDGETAKIDHGYLLSANTVEVLREYGTNSVGSDSEITSSVVQILCFTDDSFSAIASLGSGTIIRSDGVILSNLHVKEPAPGVCIAIGVNSQGIVQPDRVYPIIRSIFEDSARDIWIAQLSSIKGEVIFPSLSYKPCSAQQVKLGDAVRIYGFPYRAAKGNMVITDGIVSGINADDGSFVTSAKIDHGNSGGTALDTSKNCFIGIPTAIRGESEVYGQVVGIAALANEFPKFFVQDLKRE